MMKWLPHGVFQKGFTDCLVYHNIAAIYNIPYRINNSNLCYKEILDIKCYKERYKKFQKEPMYTINAENISPPVKKLAFYREKSNKLTRNLRLYPVPVIPVRIPIYTLLNP